MGLPSKQQPPLPMDAPDVEDVRDVPAFDVSLLALAQIPGVGMKCLRGLSDEFDGELGAVWYAPAARIRQVLTKTKTPKLDAILTRIGGEPERCIAAGAEEREKLFLRGIRLVPGKSLPQSLQSIPDPPRWLFVQGNEAVLYGQALVAVVGTRRPTPRGREATTRVVVTLAAYKDITLVSGLAEGIDEEAHHQSLMRNMTNLAFLGHGINITFPASTQDIRRRIVDRGGAVATEYLPNTHYQKSYFVQRNRLQAGISHLVIPVEANPKGGTAHTVDFAQKFGRKMVGIEWDGANGILTKIRSHGHPVVDVLSDAGTRSLDKIIVDLLKERGRDAYPLSLVERLFNNELKRRAVSRADLERLMRAIESQIAQHTSNPE
jgi:DNA processing protein